MQTFFALDSDYKYVKKPRKIKIISILCLRELQ